jgi:hypothetical protein
MAQRYNRKVIIRCCLQFKKGALFGSHARRCDLKSWSGCWRPDVVDFNLTFLENFIFGVVYRQQNLLYAQLYNRFLCRPYVINSERDVGEIFSQIVDYKISFAEGHTWT